MNQFSAEHAAKPSAPVVVSLVHVRAADGWLVGGKGANLGELIGAGFPVPAGFVVTTAAYERFVAQSSLQDIIGDMLRDAHASCAAIRTAFEAATIPPDIECHVRAAYAALDHPPVAVRSSATAEDLPQAAFAGQQDTSLSVAGTEALLDALRRCWASLGPGDRVPRAPADRPADREARCRRATHGGATRCGRAVHGQSGDGRTR